MAEILIFFDLYQANIAASSQFRSKLLLSYQNLKVIKRESHE